MPSDSKIIPPPFWELEALSDIGIKFLLDRKLSILHCRKMGLGDDESKIYFPYVRESKVVRIKWRGIESKTFGFLPSQDKEPLPFFNQWVPEDLSKLIITEGEFDCIALAGIQPWHVVSLPNGAAGVKTTFEANYDYIQQFEEIYICFDNDEAGEAAINTARRLIPASKYRRIILPAKDANAWLLGNEDADKQILTYIANAERIKSDCVVHMSKSPISDFGKLEQGKETGWVKLDEFLGGIRDGELTVVTADTGAGKTTFCLQLMGKLADIGGKIWINSYEMKPEIVIRKFAANIICVKKKFEAFSEDEHQEWMKWAMERSIYYNPSQCKTDLKTIHDQLEIAVNVYEVKYVLVDHFDYVYSTVNKKTMHEQVDEAIRELHKMCLEFQVHMFLVVHPTQSVSEDGEVKLHQLRGSASIRQYADNIITLRRMDRLDVSQSPFKDKRLQVNVRKNRMMGKEGMFFLEYEEKLDNFKECQEW